MKTIAITIDEETLRELDRFLAGRRATWRSRSRLAREALREFLAHQRRRAEEEHEREVFRRHRAKLRRQAAALVRDQAIP